MLDELTIQRAAQTDASYRKGCHYYASGRVKMLRRSAQPHTFKATVAGSAMYTTMIEFDKHLAVTDFECDCPAFLNFYNGGCKHVIAVLKKLQHDWKNWFHDTPLASLALDLPARNLLQFFHRQYSAETPVLPAGQVRLVPTLHSSIFSHVKHHALEFQIGVDRLYIVKDIPQLINAVTGRQQLTYGKNFTWEPDTANFDPFSAKLFALVKESYEEEKQRQSWSYSFSATSQSAFGEPRKLRLTNTTLQRFLHIMADQPFPVLLNNHRFDQVSVITGRPEVKLSVKAVQTSLVLALILDNDVLLGLDSDFTFIFHNQTIFHVDDQFAAYSKQLVLSVKDNKKLEVTIPAEAISEFLSTALPALESIAHIDVAPAAYSRFYKQPLAAEIYLDKLGDGVSARILFRYGEVTINPLQSTAPDHPDLKNKWLLRASADENKILGLFRQFGFTPSGDLLIQPDEEQYYLFLQHGLPELQQLADLFHADNLKLQVKPAGKVSASVRLSAKSDMLEFSLDHSEMPPHELLALLQSYKLKRRYHRLKDGAFVALDNTGFRDVATMIDQLGLKTAVLAKDVVNLPKYRALYLDSLARESGGFSLERSSGFKKMVQDIREPHDGEYKLPDGIAGKLRDYQKTGFKWLKSLSAYGMGGILADDMGLGKTLQILAFLLSEKQEQAPPSLVVAPTSLVYNWQEEAAKFTPGLNVAVIAGQQAERQEQLKTIAGADMVVTSYGMLRRDIESYTDIKFQYCILDEAQHVKNHQTISAQAVKKITARSYFALTGTPIENSLTELWSIFDFILPGYLRSHNAFTSRFEVPIVKNGDQQALTELGRHIKPFIMRRMKKAVLQELPPKVESKLTCEMTGEQAKLYHAWLLQAKAEFENEVAQNGFDKSQIKILALLTRLRQLCCHPGLFLEQYQGGSGKLDLLQEVLTDAVDSGRRVLLFSQFTGMLALIRQQLTKDGLSYHYLDGATKAEERMRLVHDFNNGSKQIFLISLKAGGTGLNLTGADMVIHYDPWWNPAVEDQATDRAYRIGQQNSVQVYKLITKDTIEEKIYQLQQKKKELIDSLIKPGENFLSKMTEAEIRELLAF